MFIILQSRENDGTNNGKKECNNESLKPIKELSGNWNGDYYFYFYLYIHCMPVVTAKLSKIKIVYFLD